MVFKGALRPLLHQLLIAGPSFDHPCHSDKRSLGIRHEAVAPFIASGTGSFLSMHLLLKEERPG